jgi:hypothetical protein
MEPHHHLSHAAPLSPVLVRLQVLLLGWDPRHRRRDERGDVPGWVLVTVMTVTIVTAIWGIAKPELVGMLRTALNSVR